MDKNTIGLDQGGQEVLADLIATGFFRLELDAAKFAMALAIRGRVGTGQTQGADTKWNVGTVDPSGEIRDLLQSLYEGVAEPYRLAEHLMNEGLKLIREDAVQRGRTDVQSLLRTGAGPE
jgi:hypothetical protein